MGEDKLNASGFEFYEGIRIAIPGAFALSLYAGVVSTFHLHAPEPLSNAVLGIVLAVALGLVLYFIDLPGQSRTYVAALPHRVIEDWDEKPPDGVTANNIYFVVLDTLMPSGIRNRALYFGSIFRIGFEAIFLAGACSVGVLTVMTLGQPSPLRETNTLILWLALPLHAIILAMVIRDGYLQAARRRTGHEAVSELGRRFWYQVGTVGTATLLIGIGSLLTFLLLCDSPVFGAVGIALPGALWAWRYENGYVPPGKPRRNIDAPAATFLLAVPSVSAMLLAALTLPSMSPLGTAAGLGWAGLALVAQLLIARRGHEKRIWAAFHTQRVWLTLNKDKVVKMAQLAKQA